MSVWTTKSLGRERNYILLQHTLRGVNHVINGVRFRESYAVVEKDSKTYQHLKRIPVLRAAKELPLTHLAKLPFIYRPADIKVVFGQEVYSAYIRERDAQAQTELALAELKKLEEQDKILKQREDELQLKIELEQKAKEAIETGDIAQAEEIKAQIPELQKCSFRTPTGNLCGFDAYDASPSGYCGKHLLDDPRLQEFGIETPRFMSKEESKSFRKKTKETLKKLKNQGKF